MGRSMMLGWLGDMLGGLIDVVFKPLMDIFNKFLQSLMTLVVGFSVNFVVEMVKCYLNVALYHITIFMLSIVDFIEMCFRAFAGLDNDGASGLRLSIDGKSGDILIQMLTSRAVLDIFFATAIVGVFLLIITTIFSMIKVEYTTEGANNSKSGIIAKSLKSLCNMLIIPLLVIFGVVIGNQVLGLIDTATGGGEGNKISGNLWVTGATNAMFANSKQLIDVDVGELGTAVVMVQNSYYTQAFLGLAAPYALQESFKKTVTDIANIWGSSTKFSEVVNSVSFMGALDDGSSHVNPDRSNIESGFKSVAKGYRYYDMQNVTTHYNILEVNYFIIILAATIIIKNLYQCCFGLIDRLYRCTALFIIMPIVVGMTPVKDSLSKWRGDFIGRALAAYGVVISMNLFFTIAAVLLSIDIDFMGTGAGSFFGNLFMKGLIQMVLVVVGCTFINKLAGDMGSYFGGTDLRATGESVQGDAKKTVQDATAGIRKAVQIAGTVGAAIATGGTSLAGKIAAQKGLGTALSSKANINTKLNTLMEGNRLTDKNLADYGAAKDLVTEQDNIIKAANSSRTQAYKDKDAADAVLNDKTASREEKAAAQKQKEEAEKTIQSSTSTIVNAKEQKVVAENMVADFSKAHAGVDQAYNLKKQADAADSEVKKHQTTLDEQKQRSEEKRALAKNAVVGMVKDEFDAGKVADQYLPGPLKGIKKSYDEHRKSENSKSPEGAKLLENETKAKAKKEEEAYEKRNASWIEPRRAAAAQTVSKAIIEKVEINNQDLNETLDKLAKRYNNATDPEDKKYIISQMRALNSNIDTPASGKFDISANASYKVNFDTAGFKKAIENAVKTNAKPQEIENIIQEQLKQWGQAGNDKLLKELHKAIEEIKNNLGK
ncbi:MAG: hypothetical protein SPK63_04620 [Eubacteriales bacterium]|nr:hypothetical protein [Eubacteriales bacterium]